MSEYDDLYKKSAFSPTKKEDLDKSWNNLWANNNMVLNSNILELMTSKNNIVEGYTYKGSTDPTLYNAITQQNSKLTSTINNMNSLYSTDDQKVLYQSAQLETLHTANTVLYLIYYALLLVIAFILVFNLPTFSIYVRGAIMAAFIIYPFIIGYIEVGISWLLGYIYALINGNVYTNGQW